MFNRDGAEVFRKDWRG